MGYCLLHFLLIFSMPCSILTLLVLGAKPLIWSSSWMVLRHYNMLLARLRCAYLSYLLCYSAKRETQTQSCLLWVVGIICQAATGKMTNKYYSNGQLCRAIRNCGVS